MIAPVLEANLCGGNGVLSVNVLDETGWHYPPCPGCVGCDPDTVSARAAAMTTEQAFALLPAIDDEEVW